MRRLLQAAMMFGAASGEAADMPGFPAWLTAGVKSTDQELGRLVRRRPGRLCLDKHGLRENRGVPDQ